MGQTPALLNPSFSWLLLLLHCTSISPLLSSSTREFFNRLVPIAGALNNRFSTRCRSEEGCGSRRACFICEVNFSSAIAPARPKDDDPSSTGSVRPAPFVQRCMSSPSVGNPFIPDLIPRRWFFPFAESPRDTSRSSCTSASNGFDVPESGCGGIEDTRERLPSRRACPNTAERALLDTPNRRTPSFWQRSKRSRYCSSTFKGKSS